MATYIKTLKEDNGDITYPQTKGSAVLLEGGSDLETVLAAKADTSTVNQKITVGDVQSTDIVANAVTTAKIADGAVTSAKTDWATMGAVKYLDTINASTIPYRSGTSTPGLAVDIRKYFANMATASSSPIVFDEIRLRFNLTLYEMNAIHYFRMGLATVSNAVVRNMLSLTANGTVTSTTADNSNIIIGMRIASNTEVIIRPYGAGVATLGDMNLVTITDNSSPVFGVDGSRVNLNSLYRLSLTNNVMYFFQDEYNGTMFTGTIRVYGIKYPTA